MNVVRKALDSFVIILAGYSLFVVLDRVLSNYLMRFPMTVGLSDFASLAYFASLNFLRELMRNSLTYKVFLSFVVVLIMALVQSVMSDGIKDAASRHAIALVLLFLTMGGYEEILYLIMAKSLPQLSLKTYQFISYIPSFLASLVIMTFTSVVYFATLKVLGTPVEEE